MGDGITVEVEGLRELEAELQALPDNLRDKGGRAAVRAATRVLRNAVFARLRATFVQRTGTLARSLATRVRIRGRTVIGGVFFKEDAWYARILHTGWQHIGGGKRAKHRRAGLRSLRYHQLRSGRLIGALPGKKIPGRPFVTQAVQDARASIEQAVISTLRRFLDRNPSSGEQT